MRTVFGDAAAAAEIQHAIVSTNFAFKKWELFFWAHFSALVLNHHFPPVSCVLRANGLLMSFTFFTIYFYGFFCLFLFWFFVLFFLFFSFLFVFACLPCRFAYGILSCWWRAKKNIIECHQKLRWLFACMDKTNVRTHAFIPFRKLHRPQTPARQWIIIEIIVTALVYIGFTDVRLHNKYSRYK